MDKKRIILFFVLIIILLGLHFSGARDYITLTRIQQSLAFFSQYVNEHYVIAVLIFILTFIGVAAALIPVTVMLNLVGGYLFGPLLGTIYILIASTGAALILFCVARYLFQAGITKRFKEQSKRFNAEMRHRGLWYLVGLNLLPFTPTPILYLIAGVSEVPLITFLGANLIGLFPGTFLYAWLGHRLPHIQSINELLTYDLLLFVVLALVLFVLVPVWMLKRKKHPKIG